MPKDAGDNVRLRELTTKRSSAKGQITKFRNYLNGIALKGELSDIEVTELSLKLAKFEALSVKVDDLQNEIEVLNPDNIVAEVDERDNIEHELIINIATAKNLLEKITKQHERRRSGLDESCNFEHYDNGLRLPQIQIAKFDGSYFRWLEFHDTFESLIHNNHRIPTINKFHYLLSYLEGDASRIVSNLEVSSANYDEAWKLLCGRYNNKRILINHHLNALFNIKQPSRESEGSLRFIVDHVTKNLRALSSLGQPTDRWDVLLIYMLSSKLDSGTLAKWEEYRNSLLNEVETLAQFNEFLINRANVLESVNRNRYENKNFSQNTNRNNFNNSHTYQKLGQTVHSTRQSFPSTSSNKYNNKTPARLLCIICGDSHRIYDCPSFKAKGYEQKMADVARFKLCINCLRQGHPTSECRMGPCRECKRKHNGLLHRPSVSSNVVIDVQQESDNENEYVVNFCNQISNQVLLSTALVEVMNPLTQQKDKVRVLLDCGSQSSFITKRLKDKLQLNTNSIDTLKIIGIGHNVLNKSIEICNVQIKSLNSNFKVSLPCLVLNELTGRLPVSPVNISQLKLPKDIKLADPNFHQPSPIDMLIGADVFWDIWGSAQHSLGANNPRLMESKLGWIISGPITSCYQSKQNTKFCNHALVSQSTSIIDSLLTKFWEIEEIPSKAIISDSDKFCENHFLLNTRRNEIGRFIVKLPLKNEASCLGESSKLARRRLFNLEKRFERNNYLKLEYTQFIQEYITLGHMSLTNSNDSGVAYHLPHHAVIKQESESTKVRVVFDGSAPTSSGYSLNDILMTGPNMQDSLFAILIRARQYKFLLTGDIEKMYRQVLVDSGDRSLQRILWRENESTPIQVYDLNTLTYGTASASYLSTRCLWQLGEEQDNELIKNIIQQDFYVDDLITGSNQEDELIYIQDAVSKALQGGCFNLRKYKSNQPSIFNNIDINKNDNLTISNSSSTLGLGWIPSTDKLYFPVKNITFDKTMQVTKRSIMSNSFKIFDPLGLLSPIVIKPKMLLQKLWQQGLDWDQPVSNEISKDWEQIMRSIQLISKLQVPRLVLCDSPQHIELHAFSDASQSAYGACIYLKSINKNNKATINLLCAKSKVAPLKPTTMPRLELCAALLAARLGKSVIESLRHKPHRLVHWCDSSIVLSWLRCDITKLKSFAANRVCAILELTKSSCWRYVPTDMNPADLISRGVDTQQLIDRQLWWSGPIFLSKNDTEWPTLVVNNNENLTELKSHSAVVNHESFIKFEKYSLLTRLQRTYAFVKRFVYNLKYPSNKRSGLLTVEELKESFIFLCSVAQRESFPKEFILLSNNKLLDNKSKILALSPFFDKYVIRVGGRIGASEYSFEKKHPILLHSSHHLTKLYFRRQHMESLHAGPQLLLAIIRESVWPVNGRHLARRTVNDCVRCKRIRGQTLCPKMGDLPAQRINPGHPFTSVGLDFAGPFSIVNKKGRGARLIKCYLCLFVCLRFKCIHLEAVSDLTKDAFIMTLRRFIARRGKPTEIFCDNGRNFVAAAKEIGNFIENVCDPIFDFASHQGIKFRFIPTYAPHFGGIWEAGVKSAKHHLRRVMGNSNLTFEEITTLFAQVEAILNSRPLYPLSSCPNDLIYLTPGHFLIGRQLTALPPPHMDCKDNALKRYARLESIRLHFWKRWQREYIGELQQRKKWRTDTARLNVGDMVLLQEDGVPPMQWRLGRVARLFPGPDGVARVADVNTVRGCVRRPFTRLCPLHPAEEEELIN